MICAINEENSDCRILEEISAFVINYIYSGLYDFYSSHEFVFGYNKRNRKEQIQKNNENKLKIDIEKEQVMDRKRKGFVRGGYAACGKDQRWHY